MKSKVQDALAVTLPFAFSVIVCVSGCLVRDVKQAGTVATEPVVSHLVANAFAPVKAGMIAQNFHNAKNRWPRDKGELAEYALKENIQFDFEQFTTIRFDPETGPTTAMVVNFAPPVIGSCTSYLTGAKMNKGKR